MKLSDFKIGNEFVISGRTWRCTDIGTRVVTAIEIDEREDKSWFDGPTYAVPERVFDENDQPACEPSLSTEGR